MSESTDKVIGVCHEGLCESGGRINVLLVLTFCGGIYFDSCNTCCTVLLVKQPLKTMYEKLDRLYNKCGYREISGYLFSCSPGYSVITIQNVP